jgi:non-specific serine/threonine protein kinase
LWSTLPSAQIARQQVASTVINGQLWIAGGLTSGTATAEVESYDPVIQQWSTAPSLPVPLHHAMAVNYKGIMVVLGGWIPSGSDVEATVSNRVFALEQGRWLELPPMLDARAAGAAAVVGNDIVVTGGQANHQLVRATDVFTGLKWSNARPIPTPRDHLAAVSDGHYMYAIGGRDLSSDKNSAAVERYDPATNVWILLPPLPTARGGLGAAMVGINIVTAGGESPTGVYNNVESYSLSLGRWSILPPMRTPRHGLALLSVGSTLYAIDGATAAGHTHSTNVNEALDLSSYARPARWSGLPSSPTSRQQVGAAVLNGTLWIVGGLTTGAATAKVEGYDPVIQNWTAGPDLPIPLHHVMAVTYHDALVVLGGWTPSGGNIEGTVSNRVFELQNGQWTELPPMLQPRAAGAAAVVGNEIVVTGGQANHQLVTDTERFDGTKWSEAAPMPTLRDHLAAVSDGHYVYALGGRALSSAKNSAALERYDPSKNDWTTLPNMPTARGGLGAAIVGNQIVAVGGESPTGVYDNIEAYDLVAHQWSILPPMRTPRHGLALLAVGQTIYAIDGAKAAGHTNSTNLNEALVLP